MRIAVYGTGGVGGYFGGRLAQAGVDVHFIARGAQLQALRQRGLTVRSVHGDFRVQAPATDDPADVGRCDFVLFCVKTFDTDAAAARLGSLVGNGTAVVSLQNGIENVLKLDGKKDWIQIRRELTDEQIKNIYFLYEALWPLETDLLALLVRRQRSCRFSTECVTSTSCPSGLVLRGSWAVSALSVRPWMSAVMPCSLDPRQR